MRYRAEDDLSVKVLLSGVHNNIPKAILLKEDII